VAQVVVEDNSGDLVPWTGRYPAVPADDVLASLLAVAAGLPDPQPCEPLGPDWRLVLPLRPTRNVICVGTNYLAHVAEFSSFLGTPDDIPSAPVVFTKVPEALCGPNDDIRVDPRWTSQLDYEVELGVVIGRAGAHIAPETAYDHVAGYTIVNDTTARDRQKLHKQWFLAKSLVGATPMGPVVVTPDELSPLGDIELRSVVDDEERQKALVRDMIFDIPTLLSAISAVFPLRAGDVIATGTPSGVGISFDPPRFLEDGSLVECTIGGIGTLANRVRMVPGESVRSSTGGQKEAYGG
jgi:2-keto-4-pentenoate hydratase/2-oxohepta-3-ene-1,7-dioic acid hydratase in catechol pathway